MTGCFSDKDARQLRQAIYPITVCSNSDGGYERSSNGMAVATIHILVQRVPNYLPEKDIITTGVLALLLNNVSGTPATEFQKVCTATLIDLVGQEKAETALPAATERLNAISKSSSASLPAAGRAIAKWLEEPSNVNLDELVYRFRSLRRYLQHHQ